MVNARIERDANGTRRIFCKRAKFKHWHELGKHNETDAEFERALQAGTVEWEPRTIDRSTLFAKIY